MRISCEGSRLNATPRGSVIVSSDRCVTASGAPLLGSRTSTNGSQSTGAPSVSSPSARR